MNDLIVHSGGMYGAIYLQGVVGGGCDQDFLLSIGGVKGEGVLNTDIVMSYSPGGDAVGQNPSIIFRQLYSRAKHRQETIQSIDGALTADNVLYKLNAADHCYYLFYKEVVKEFLLQGYSEQKAEKHIKQWIDYDLASIAYRDGYKLVALADVI